MNKKQWKSLEEKGNSKLCSWCRLLLATMNASRKEISLFFMTLFKTLENRYMIYVLNQCLALTSFFCKSVTQFTDKLGKSCIQQFFVIDTKTQEIYQKTLKLLGYKGFEKEEEKTDQVGE